MKVSALITLLLLLGLLAVLSFFQKSSIEVQWTKPKLQYEVQNEPSTFKWQGPSKQDLSLADYKGQMVLATLWSYSCWPCLKELPLINQVTAKIGDQDLIVLAFHVGATSEEKDQAMAFWQDENLTFQNFFVTPEWAEQAFKTNKLPSHFLFNREGKLMWQHEGPIQWIESPMEQFLSKALLESQPADGFEDGEAPGESSE